MTTSSTTQAILREVGVNGARRFEKCQQLFRPGAKILNRSRTGARGADRHTTQSTIDFRGGGTFLSYVESNDGSSFRNEFGLRATLPATSVDAPHPITCTDRTNRRRRIGTIALGDTLSPCYGVSQGAGASTLGTSSGKVISDKSSSVDRPFCIGVMSRRRRASNPRDYFLWVSSCGRNDSRSWSHRRRTPVDSRRSSRVHVDVRSVCNGSSTSVHVD